MTGNALPADLRSVLSRAAALGAGGRQVAVATPEEAIGAVLDAVAACILPRSLTVADDSGPLLVLEAAAGHLIRLTDVSPKLQAKTADLLSRPLLAADLGPMAALLGLAFPGGQIITFSTSALQTSPDPAQTGLACPAILHQLGLTPFDTAVPDRLAHLIEAADEVLIALYRPGQTPQLTQPEVDLPSDLAALATRAFEQMTDQTNPLQRNDILFFTPKGHADLAVGLAQMDSGPVVLVFAADSLPDIAAYWANMANVPLVCDSE